ncbi:MAG: patatin-like phospholipase family protein [Acidiferrobacter sp.]
MPVKTRPGLVLALGAGGARGLAHIGVLQVLAEQGIAVRAVAGSSIGAEIGALYAHGHDPASIATVALGVSWKQTLRLFLPDRGGGGFCSGRKIVEFLTTHLGESRVDQLNLPLLVIATDLWSGEEVVLQDGPVVAAVRASISLPGLLSPFPYGDRLLVDGGIVNPVPFDVARQRFGGPVVAVAVHQGARELSVRGMTPHVPAWRAQLVRLRQQPWTKRVPPLREWLEEQLAVATGPVHGGWRVRSVLTQAVNIAQAQVVQLRRASAPPDLYLSPDVDAIGPFEFYKARDAIAAGRAVAREHLADLYALATDGQARASDSSSPGPS